MKKLCLFSVISTFLAAGLSAQEYSSAQPPASYGRSSGNRILMPGRHRISIDAGYSHRTAKPYFSDLNSVNWRSGISYGATYHWFFKFGLGVGGNLMGQNYDYTLSHKRSRINNIFVAPSVMYRLFLGDSGKLAFVAGFSTGYVHYFERTTSDGAVLTDSTVNSDWLASFYEAGFDFRIAPKVYLGLTVNYFAGSVPVPGRDYIMESLNAVGIRGGVRF